MTTVVMVHGAFCGGWAFESFRQPFEALGWDVVAPDLPGREAQGGSGLSMSHYADHLVEVCADLAEPPILVGHSMGGLVCQMATRRVRPRALVLLAPSPPWGVMPSSLEEAATALGVGLANPFWSGDVRADRTLMRAHGLNRVPEGHREAILDRMCAESGRAVREVLNWWLDPMMTTSVGPGTLPAPSIAIVGGRDLVHSPVTVRSAADRIGATFREMPGMSHWLIGEHGWEDVADTALSWLAAEGVEAA